MRYERKYILNQNKELIFRNFLIKNNFKNLFEKRKINSIYFDTRNFKFYRENIEGISQRKKVRLRWYNDNINNSIIEIKNKNGFLGWKDYYKIKINLDNLDKNNNQFNKIKIFNKYNLFPIVKITYFREYFLSFCGKFRATLDTDIKINHKINKNYDDFHLDKSVMEFKYEKNNDTSFRKFLKSVEFNFRFQKYSKYVSGLHLLKRNFLI